MSDEKIDNANLVQFLEILLEKAKKKEVVGMAGVVFDTDYSDLYYTAGFAPRALVIGGVSLFLEDLKVHAMYENHGAEDQEDDGSEEDESDDAAPKPGTTTH